MSWRAQKYAKLSRLVRDFPGGIQPDRRLAPIRVAVSRPQQQNTQRVQARA